MVSVLASDAFFPFNDCAQVADKAGIKAIVQPWHQFVIRSLLTIVMNMI